MPKRHNITNQQFGRLVALYDCGSRHGRRLWWCRCACGTEKAIKVQNLRSGHTKSCGCLRRERSKESTFTGCGQLSGQQFAHIKNHASTRGIPFLISVDEAWQTFVQQDKKCALTGVLLTFSSANNRSDGTASLDRIDSKLGYTVENIQWVHKKINRMKWDLEQTEFVRLCQLVAQHRVPHA
jgi:hypothetical protein